MESKIPTAESIRITNPKEYNEIHKWIRETYGKADRCENNECKGISKKFDWALKTNCSYKKDMTSFIQLCRSCHVAYDFTKQRSNKISKAQIGELNSFYGKCFTEEMKEKQRSKKISKSVRAFNINTSEEIIFISISECWKKLDLKKSNVIAYLKGRYNGKTYKGWEFTYL
jgi:hypothetical protein